MVDVKRRHQINPELTDAEMQAIFDSFHIIGGDMEVCYRNEQGKTVLNSFKEIVRECFMMANKMPTARLWLRRIPEGMQIACTDDDIMSAFSGSSATVVERCILFTLDMFWKNSLKNTSIALVHELAHMIDCQDMGGLSIFPYEPVNDGVPFRCASSEMRTEAELMQLALIDEAEKNALTRQLKYESGSDELPTEYIAKMDSLFKRYIKVFSGWQPPKEAGVWTEKEVKEERFNRAIFYASTEMVAAEIREFLKPYPQLISELPRSIQVSSQNADKAKLINLQEVKRLNLSKAKLRSLWGKVLDIQRNLEYRCLVYNNLVRYICWQYARQSKHNTPITHDYFFNVIEPDIKKRLKIIPNKPSQYFADYVQRMEGRYMGFIRAKELEPRNSSDRIYLYEDKENPVSSLINISASFVRMETLAQGLLQDFRRILYPYCVERSIFMNVSRQQLTQSKSPER